MKISLSAWAVLAGTGSVREVRMFGGLCFMLNGNMVAGASKRGLLVRVGKHRIGSRPIRGLCAAPPCEKRYTVSRVSCRPEALVQIRTVEPCIW